MSGTPGSALHRDFQASLASSPIPALPPSTQPLLGLGRALEKGTDGMGSRLSETRPNPTFCARSCARSCAGAEVQGRALSAGIAQLTARRTYTSCLSRTLVWRGESHTPLRVHTNGTGSPLGSVQGSGLCRRGQGVAQPATLPGLTGRHRNQYVNPEGPRGDSWEHSHRTLEGGVNDRL